MHFVYMKRSGRWWQNANLSFCFCICHDISNEFLIWKYLFYLHTAYIKRSGKMHYSDSLEETIYWYKTQQLAVLSLTFVCVYHRYFYFVHAFAMILAFSFSSEKQDIRRFFAPTKHVLQKPAQNVSISPEEEKKKKKSTSSQQDVKKKNKVNLKARK